MVRVFCAALFASSVSTAALAATYEPDSAIDAVTVYPSGAQVTREAAVDVEAGEHMIVIDDLPAHIDPASVRVSGIADGSLAIGGVDVRTVVIQSGGSDDDRARLEARLNDLNDLAASLQQQRADIQTRRDLLQVLVRNSATGGDDDGVSLSAISLTDTLGVVADQLSDLNAQTVATRAQERETQSEITRVRSQLALLAPKQEQRTVVEIAVSSAQATAAEFAVTYNVREAGWRAIYDASLDLNDGIEDIKLGLKRRALVEQATQEPWDDVELTLSTARPTSATSAPNLQANILDQIAEPRLMSRAHGETATQYSADAAEVVAVAKAAAPQALMEADQRVAQMETGGFNANFAINGRVSVSNTREAKSVLLGVDEVDVDVHALSVPRLDPTAYLVAAFELDGEVTYLPGDVLLTRDSTYIGRGHMPLLAPGDTHELGFGNDDFITVERIEKDRKQGETGILVSSNTELREAVINATNNHDFAMPVRIVDRLPVADHEDIQIEPLTSNTSPSETDVDGKRGVLAFDLDVAPGGTDTINLGYEVTWPSDMRITRLH